MFPREHGAYGQLLFPVATALAVGHASLSALALAVSGIAVFLAHEPLLVLLGQRGARAARDDRGRAKRWLAGAAGIAIVSGAVAIASMAPHAVITLALPLGFGAILAVLVATRREHTTAGEILAAAALSSLALPVGIAAGVPSPSAVTVFVVYALIFATATVSVRAVIAANTRARTGPSRLVAASIVVAGVGALALASRAGQLPAAAPWTALPVCLVGFGIAVRPPASRHLRKIGWTLVGASAVTAALLIATLR